MEIEFLQSAHSVNMLVYVVAILNLACIMLRGSITIIVTILIKSFSPMPHVCPKCLS